MEMDRVDYIIDDGEFNLAQMEINTMREIKLAHPKITMEGMAEKLGISVHELSSKMLNYNLNDNYECCGLKIDQLEINLIKHSRMMFPNATHSFLADKIGMSERTLQRKIKDYGIKIPKAKTLKRLKKAKESQITSLQLYRR